MSWPARRAAPLALDDVLYVRPDFAPAQKLLVQAKAALASRA